MKAKLATQPLSFFTTKPEDKSINLNHLRYSINLMWINRNKNEHGDYVCSGNNQQDMNYIFNQLNKWRVANPEAEINFWYDSQCTNSNSIENTRKCLEDISTESLPPINLRDIREIPFVQANSDFFQTTIPVYFRVDFLKLIICLYLLENKEMDSAIFADTSIGAKVERVLSKQELYHADALKNLCQYGMLLGQDTWKPENQFIQTLNTPELIASLKHAINCCLFITKNALNFAIEDQNENILDKLYYAPFKATIIDVYAYLLVLKSKEPVKIRADIVREGNIDEWVTYNPEKHEYMMFGNMPKAFEIGNFYVQNRNTFSLNDIIKLPEILKFYPNIDSFWSLGKPITGHVVRNDLNPGKSGGSHSWTGPLPHPTHGHEFHCSFWPQQMQEEQQSESKYGVY